MSTPNVYELEPLELLASAMVPQLAKIPVAGRQAAQGARAGQGAPMRWPGTLVMVCEEPAMSRRSRLSAEESAFVQAQRVARLATADAQGHPHVVPVCYAFDGARFYTPLDEKPKRVEVRQLRRVRNIEARHEAALLIDRYADDWSQLGYVLVEGTASLLEPGADLHAQACALLRARYPQYAAMQLEERPIIVITPQAVTSWGPALQSAFSWPGDPSEAQDGSR